MRVTDNILRRRGGLGLLLAATTTAPFTAAVAAPATRIEVWKDPTCGCCEGWVRHMPAAGFKVAVREVADVQLVKTANGVSEAL